MSRPKQHRSGGGSAVRRSQPTPDPRGERLQKVLAAAGIASRRECEQIVLEGRVEVDGQIVTELGTRVDPSKQNIRVDGTALLRPRLLYFALNKPTGVVTTARDPWARTRVIDLVPDRAGRVFAVGRLDMASEGLVLLTNDGELTNRLAHPRYGIEKTYQVQVAGDVSQDVIERLLKGIWIAEGRVRPERVSIDRRYKQSTILNVVLREGKNREIRRILAALGHKVQRLRRMAIGPLTLGDLPLGEYRPLSHEEIRDLKDAAYQDPVPRERKPDRPPRESRPAARTETDARPAKARFSKSPAKSGGEQKSLGLGRSRGREKSARGAQGQPRNTTGGQGKPGRPTDKSRFRTQRGRPR